MLSVVRGFVRCWDPLGSFQISPATTRVQSQAPELHLLCLGKQLSLSGHVALTLSHRPFAAGDSRCSLSTEAISWSLSYNSRIPPLLFVISPQPSKAVCQQCYRSRTAKALLGNVAGSIVWRACLMTAVIPQGESAISVSPESVLRSIVPLLSSSHLN